MRTPSAVPILACVLLAPSAAGGLPLFEPPWADFVWSPAVPRAGERVEFTSLSHDPDGIVILHEWTFQGHPDRLYGPQPDFTFASRGGYAVTLQVWDATLAQSRVTRTVSVAGTPPVASILVEPNVTYRGVPTTFHGVATDADGDAISAWRWQIGSSFHEGQNVTRTFDTLGTVDVALSVEDAEGMLADAARAVHVLNRPPVVTGHHAPEHPVVGQPVTFMGTGMDPDVPNGAVTLRWTFSDGATFEGAEVQRVFSAPGDHTVTLRGHDADGGVSAPHVIAFRVRA